MRSRFALAAVMLALLAVAPASAPLLGTGLATLGGYTMLRRRLATES